MGATSAGGLPRLASAGSVARYDPDTFKRLGEISGGEVADEFGTRVSDTFIATAPGAAGGGRVYLIDIDDPGSSISGTDLEGGLVERFGEDWADLGHPTGTNNAVAIGAPGSVDDDPSRLATTPAVVVVNWNDDRFTREVRRVEGEPGSLFGWRVRSADPQLPASFFGSFVVGAPLEDRGSRERAGAVYKFNTETGAQVWRFRGEWAGELVGFDIDVISDQDGDGVSDVLVGAPGSRTAEPAGRVYLLSGVDGSVIDTLEAPEGALLFGYSVGLRSSFSAVTGFLVSAPATAKGKKEGVGAIYVFADLEAEPDVFQGKRRDQWFGVSFAHTPAHLLVGSFEGHKRAAKDHRGSVTALTSSGKQRKLLRGKSGGDYFGRALSVGAAVAIGIPGSPPLFVPE